MHCIDGERADEACGRAALFSKLAARLAAWVALAGTVWLAGCSSPAPTATPEPSAPAASPGEGGNRTPGTPGAAVHLPPPGPVRSWAEVRLQAARRMLAANPALTYDGEVPEPLLAIPVLEIELNADGSVRRIEYLRLPSQAEDTVQLAVEAVRRAAPFGDVSRLPKPWRFTETFLFNDDRKFKPRTLDQ